MAENELPPIAISAIFCISGDCDMFCLTPLHGVYCKSLSVLGFYVLSMNGYYMAYSPYSWGDLANK